MKWEGLFNAFIAIWLDQIWQGPLITNASMSRSDVTDILPGTVGNRRLGLKQARGREGGSLGSRRLPSEPVEKHTGEEVLLLYPHRGQEFGWNLYRLFSANFVTRRLWFCVYDWRLFNSILMLQKSINFQFPCFHDRIIKLTLRRKHALKNQS